MNGISLRLTHKISAIGIVGVVGVILVGAIHMYGESATSGYRIAAEDARSISELNDRIEIELLEGRRAEKDFLLRNDSKRAEKQIQISKSVAADMETLRQKVVAVGKPDLGRQIEAMNASLKQYQGHFAAVVDQKLKLGLDENAGLEGRLRVSVHDIEAKVAALHKPVLMSDMLMMRRHEKDFMLRRDRKYGDEMKKSASDFTADVDAADISEAAKAELKQKLGEYQRDFFAWMESALTLSDELKATSDAFSAVEPVIETVSKAIDDARSSAEHASTMVRENVQWQMEIAILSIALSVLGASFFIGRSVSKPLSATSTTARSCCRRSSSRTPSCISPPITSSGNPWSIPKSISATTWKAAFPC